MNDKDNITVCISIDDYLYIRYELEELKKEFHAIGTLLHEYMSDMQKNISE